MLRKIFIGFLALFVSLGIAGTALADDITDLQNAVNAGGTVVIDRDYSLDGGCVVVGNDVEIVGNGINKIIGGAPTFLIDNKDANVTISGVPFVRPIGAAIQVYKCKTANILGNTITDVTLAGVKSPIGAAIRISELKGSPFDAIPLDPSEVADLGNVGKVVVENNIIDVLGNFNPPKVYYSGGIWVIYIVDTDDDNVTELSIVGNTISNPGDSGINITGTAGVSKTEILGNTINQRTYKNTTELMRTVFCAGMGTYYYFNSSWDPVNDVGIGPAPVTMKDNKIYNCPTAGIIADSIQYSLFENNYIEMVDLDTLYCFGINLCLGGVPNPGRPADIPRTIRCEFKNNKIVGAAKLGIRISENSEYNVFLNNDTSELTVFADPAGPGMLPPPNSGYHYSFVPSGFGGSCHNRIKGESKNATILDPDSCNVF